MNSYPSTPRLILNYFIDTAAGLFMIGFGLVVIYGITFYGHRAGFR